MKRLFSVILTIVMLIGVFYTFKNSDLKTAGTASKAAAEVIGKNLIRFHVIANSDSDKDQSVKLEIRDAILSKLGPKLEKLDSTKEAEDYLNNNLNMIIQTANEILGRESMGYTATALVGPYEFPVKSYNSVTLPAGEYTALRVVLGNGDGKNWWCVMFPPLCFIDVTQGLTEEKTDQQLSRVMTTQEVDSITTIMEHTGDTAKAQTIDDKDAASSQTISQSTESSVEFRFKTVELIKGFINKLKQK